MAAAILDALREPEQARGQAWCGRQVVLENYNWDTLADRMERVWLSCVPSLQGKERT
jgi:hypothetical protein